MNVGCLDDIVDVVNSSGSANVAQLVGTQEGERVVSSYNSAEMFGPQFHKLKIIKTYQHFRFDASMPGVVHYKTSSDSEEQMIVLLKNTAWSEQASSLPNPVVPAGLSVERQWYLYNTIAEYCPETVRERVCPKPNTPLGAALTAHITSSTSTNMSSSASTDGSMSAHLSTTAASSTSAQPAKKARVCSQCKQPGHNA